MLSVDTDINVGSVVVNTTENKGLSPEYWTERILERLVSISEGADPMVKAQAEAFRDSIKQVVLSQLQKAMTTACKVMDRIIWILDGRFFVYSKIKS